MSSEPTLVVEQNLFRFLRSLLGRGEGSEVLLRDTPIGPHFELGPEPLSSSDANLPASTFTFSDGREVTRIQVRTGRGDDDLIAGELVPEPSGSWRREELSPIDSDFLWVVGFDAAGNNS